MKLNPVAMTCRGVSDLIFVNREVLDEFLAMLNAHLTSGDPRREMDGFIEDIDYKIEPVTVYWSAEMAFEDVNQGEAF